jgi:hypothetical protein
VRQVIGAGRLQDLWLLSWVAFSSSIFHVATGDDDSGLAPCANDDRLDPLFICKKCGCRSVCLSVYLHNQFEGNRLLGRQNLMLA